MSDKDDLFAADEEFGDLENDDFFSDDVAEEEPVKPVVRRAAAPAPAEVENEVEAEEEPVKAQPMESKITHEVHQETEEEAESEEPEVEETETEEAEPIEEEPEEEVEEDDNVISEADDAEAVEAEAVAEAEEAPKPPKAAPKKGTGKRAVKPLTARQKAVNNILRKAGLEDELPTLDHILRGKQGDKVKISDIAVFISEPENEVLKELYKDMKLVNRVNLSAEVDFNRVRVVGGLVLGAGRMYQPIQVARIEEDGALECTSGRHRLVALALAYGTDIEIPVYIEDMDLNAARDCVVFANTARKAKAMEQAEHAVLAAVGGDVDADQDEIYNNTVKNKSTMQKYCTYSILDRGVPAKLAFSLGSRKDGALATIGTIEGFWGASLDWNKAMTRKEFDANLKEAVNFVNELALAFQADASFDAGQHMASMTMKAIGKYYRTLTDAGVSLDVNKLTSAIVAMGDIGRQKSEETYAAIVKAMK